MRKMQCLFTLQLLLLTISSHAQLRGDSEAIEMARQIVSSVGGGEVWANARSLHVIEKSRSLNGDGIVGEFWRDLVTPRERYTLSSRNGIEIEFWWDHRGVYQLIDGERQSLPQSLHAEVQSYWQGEIYVMYHRFAANDNDLELRMNTGNSFTASSSSLHRELGTFWVNEDGDLYRWRHQDGTEYIYGPHRDFGDISFPDWGTQVDGSWSFYYVDVVASQQPLAISFEPPG